MGRSIFLGTLQAEISPSDYTNHGPYCLPIFVSLKSIHKENLIANQCDIAVF